MATTTTTNEIYDTNNNNTNPQSNKKNYSNIDAFCDIVNDNKNRQVADSNMAKKMEEDNKKRAARYVKKTKAKNMVFWMAIISAVCSTCVIGVVSWMLFDIKEWLFAVIMDVIGMANTLLHTFMYRYIREEIYRK